MRARAMLAAVLVVMILVSSDVPGWLVNPLTSPATALAASAVALSE